MRVPGPPMSKKASSAAGKRTLICRIFGFLRMFFRASRKRAWTSTGLAVSASVLDMASSENESVFCVGLP